MLEYRRAHSRTKARRELVALTAMIAVLNVSGFVKLGVTPGGGFPEGILERSVPGGNAGELMVAAGVQRMTRNIIGQRSRMRDTKKSMFKGHEALLMMQISENVRGPCGTA